jgi:hypothetical protein
MYLNYTVYHPINGPLPQEEIISPEKDAEALPRMVVHSCNPKTQGAKARGS